MPVPIVLLTDFGLADPYTAQMKGAVLCRAPDAALVDLSHEVEPGNLLQAGFLLAATLPHFPADTVFVAVVDPGVGTSRRILCARFPGPGSLVLAPDNGLLGLALAMHAATDRVDIRDCSPAVAELTAAGPVAATFHGRDLFAPLAARLALGQKPQDLGPALKPTDLVAMDLPALIPADSGDRIEATVLHADRFGNAVLSLLPERERPVPGFTLHLPGRDPAPLRRVSVYADLAPGQLGILPGSQGFLELAMNQDSAARRLGLCPGRTLTLTRNAP